MTTTERTDRLYVILAPYKKDDEPLGLHQMLMWKTGPLTYHHYIEIPAMASAEDLLGWLSDEKNYGASSPVKWKARAEYIDKISEDFTRNWSLVATVSEDRPRIEHDWPYEGRVFSQSAVLHWREHPNTKIRSFVLLIEGDFMIGQIEARGALYECAGPNPVADDIERIMSLGDRQETIHMLWLHGVVRRLNKKAA